MGWTRTRRAAVSIAVAGAIAVVAAAPSPAATGTRPEAAPSLGTVGAAPQPPQLPRNFRGKEGGSSGIWASQCRSPGRAGTAKARWLREARNIPSGSPI